MEKLREFSGIDFYGWGGANNFADGSVPCIAEGNEGTLIVSGSDENDGSAIVSVYFGDDESDWGFKTYESKEEAINEAEILVDLLDVELDVARWCELGFDMM